MEIRNVHLLDDEGKKTKLAAHQDIGSYLKVLASSDPAVWRAYKALLGAGGQVFIVGGAVRDALMGKEPSDLDLMVTGLPPEVVRHTLAQLPGKLVGTGSLDKDADEDKVEDTAHAFGVYHYREGGAGGHAVEIALPRREHSTGEAHKDFESQVDHTMTPEEDLFRR